MLKISLCLGNFNEWSLVDSCPLPALDGEGDPDQKARRRSAYEIVYPVIISISCSCTNQIKSCKSCGAS